jgi:hypothetical protein
LENIENGVLVSAKDNGVGVMNPFQEGHNGFMRNFSFLAGKPRK